MFMFMSKLLLICSLLNYDSCLIAIFLPMQAKTNMIPCNKITYKRWHKKWDMAYYMQIKQSGSFGNDVGRLKG